MYGDNARSEAKSVAKGCGSQPTQRKIVIQKIALLGQKIPVATGKFHHQKNYIVSWPPENFHRKHSVL